VRGGKGDAAGAGCRCAGRVDAALRLGRISRDRLQFVDPDAERVRHLVDANEQIARLHDAANLLRTLPAAYPPHHASGSAHC
jgi:hypothetical protein